MVLSDMCPLVSGISTRDAASYAELGMQALGRAATAHLDDDFRIHRPLSDSVNVADDNGTLQPGGNKVMVME